MPDGGDLTFHPEKTWDIYRISLMSEDYPGEEIEKLNERLQDKPDEEKPRYRWASKEKVLSAAQKILAENSEFYQRLAQYDRRPATGRRRVE
jgi:hypothetical protein